MPVPDFSPGEVLTAAAMDSIGLWKVAAGTLSLTTSPTNVTGVFDSTKYKNYRLLLNMSAKSVSNRFDMKYIVGTTPTSSGYFQNGIGSDYASNTTFYFQRSNADPQFYFDTGSNAINTYSFDIYRPNDAVATTHHGTVYSLNAGVGYTVGGANTNATAFTGFQLFTSTGTMTMNYQIFGYRD